MKTTYDLIDRVTGKKIQVIVEKEEHTDGYINIFVEGYGDKYSVDGAGSPITIDFFNNKLQVIVRGDINKEDPTHFIDIEGAKESNRVKDHNKAMASQDD